ncbi:MAG: hypothetical protein EA363_12310 [Balneolaceae bacterium]|nr:MAG: hypothetical protein EA363_12310 [Balneolaceae bacterium]
MTVHDRTTESDNLPHAKESVMAFSQRDLDQQNFDQQNFGHRNFYQRSVTGAFPVLKVAISATLLALFIMLPCYFWTQPAAAQNASTRTGERIHLERGTEYLRQGNLQMAISSLEKAVDAGHDADQAWFLLARAYGMSGSYEQGLRTAEEGLARYPDHAALEYARLESLAFLDPMQAAEMMERLYRERGDDLELRARGLEPHHIRAHAGHLYAIAGTSFHSGGMLQESAAALETARSLIPDTLYVHNNLVYTLIMDGAYDRAAEAADEALQRFPHDRNIRLLKNQALSLSGRGEDGLDMIRELYREDPDDPEAAIAYGQALLRAGRMQDAADHYDDYLERNPQQRRVYDVLIRMNRQQFQYRHLAQVLERKAEAFPDEWRIRRELAEVLGLIEEFERAHEEYELLYELSGDAVYRLLQARLLLTAEDFERAAERYEAMIADYGPRWTGAEAYEELTLLWLHLGEPEKAVQVARSGREHHGLSAAVRERELEALWAAGDRVGSREAAEEMEQQSLMLTGLAPYVLSETQDDPEKSTEWLISALERELDYTKRTTQRFGETAQMQLSGQMTLHYPVISDKDELQRRERYLEMMAARLEALAGPDDRIRHYRSLLDRFDGSVWVMQQTAQALLEAGDTDRATSMLTRAARSAPRDPEIHRHIAQIYERGEDITGALQAWERALAADSEMEEAYRQLIRLHRRNGTLDGLCDRWMARHRADPQNELLAEFLVDALHRAGRYEEARQITQRRQ